MDAASCPATARSATTRCRRRLDKASLDAADAEAAGRRTKTEMPDQPWQRTVRGSFLVAAYRRPEFRVDATLRGDPGAGRARRSRASVNARYLFGAPMANRPVAWTYSRTPFLQAPAGVLNRVSRRSRSRSSAAATTGVRPESGQLGSKTADARRQGRADARSRHPAERRPVRTNTRSRATSKIVSRQHIAGRASFVVHPAPWYIGLKRPSLFVDQKDGIEHDRGRGGSGRDAGRRRQGRSDAGRSAVAQRAPRRRQRLLRAGRPSATKPRRATSR